MPNLLDIWNFEAFQLRGIAALAQIKPWVGHSTTLYWQGSGAISAHAWAVEQTPNNEWGLFIEHASVYDGSRASCEAIVGMFAWWHSQQGEQ